MTPAGSCTTVVGAAQIWLSFDGGESFVPSESAPPAQRYATGPVLTDDSGRLVAVEYDHLIESTNAGCRWVDFGSFYPCSGLVQTVSGTTIAWYVSGEAVSIIEGLPQAWTCPEGIVAVSCHSGVDRLQVIDRLGQFLESTDMGGVWRKTQQLPVTPSLPYAAAWDPTDPNHLVVGAVKHGVLSSFDGGASFTAALGLGEAGNTNGFTIAISRALGSIVWAQVLDIGESDLSGGQTGRYIARSADGGVTFTRVIGQSADVPQYNQVPVWPHPAEPDVAYFSLPGRLYRVDARTSALSSAPTPGVEIAGIEFSPSDPRIMYMTVNSTGHSIGIVGPADGA